MQLRSVKSFSIKKIIENHESQFDLAIFASGYESRSIVLPKLLHPSRLSRVAIFSFAELKNIASRDEVVRFYGTMSNAQIFEMEGGDDVAVYSALRELTSDFAEDRPLRIFVDFSSMSRVWYGAILNFFRHMHRTTGVHLYLGYMAGRYHGEVRANQVQIISAVPGFEGIAAGSSRSCAVFALGFDPWCAYAIMERIEPDVIWALIADRPDLPEYLERAKNLNRDFIRNYAHERVLIFPTFDIEGVFGRLCEWVSQGLAQTPDITLIGLGPKPHILSMMLAAIRFPEVTIVQARGQPVSPKDVPSEGQGVCALVEFIPERVSRIIA